MAEKTDTESKAASRFDPPSSALTIDFFVGLFTLVGIACLAYLAIGIANMRLFGSNSYDVVAEFINVSGLENGAPVEIAGVPVGVVTDIKLSDTMASVTLSINNGVPIRTDDIVSIRTKGIIGDKYIRIIPGASDETVPAGGSIYDTDSPMDIEEIIGKLIHRME